MKKFRELGENSYNKALYGNLLPKLKAKDSDPAREARRKRAAAEDEKKKASNRLNAALGGYSYKKEDAELAEVAQPRSPDEQRFVDLHTIEFWPHPVALDSQFDGTIEKDTSRDADYQPGEDEAVYDTSYTEAIDIETIRRREKAYGGPKRPSTKDEMEKNRAARIAKVLARRAADNKRHSGTNESVEHGHAYAVGMSAAKKAEHDEPPLRKKTITKAHRIAKKILANEATDSQSTHTWDHLNKVLTAQGHSPVHIRNVLSAHNKVAGVNAKSYTWDQTNKALMATGHKAPQILKIMSGLNRVKKASVNEAVEVSHARYLRSHGKKHGHSAVKVAEGLEEAMKLDKVNIIHHAGGDKHAADFAKHYRNAHIGDYRQGGPTEKDEKASDKFHGEYDHKNTRSGFAGSGTTVYTHKATGKKFEVDRSPNGKGFHGTDHHVRHITEETELQELSAEKLSHASDIAKYRSKVASKKSDQAMKGLYTTASGKRHANKFNRAVTHELDSRKKAAQSTKFAAAAKKKLGEDVSVGELKFKDGSKITVTNEAAKVLNALFHSLDKNRQTEMQEHITKSSKNFKAVLEFAKSVK